MGFLDPAQHHYLMDPVFLERLERQSSLDSVGRCFPLQVLSLEASVRAFYDFYGI
jgi:hypothetical protein